MQFYFSVSKLQLSSLSELKGEGKQFLEKRKYNMLGMNYFKFASSPVKEIEMETTTLGKFMAINPVQNFKTVWQY